MVGEVLKTSCRLSEACGGSRGKYPEPVLELFNFDINIYFIYLWVKFSQQYNKCHYLLVTEKLNYFPELLICERLGEQCSCPQESVGIVGMGGSPWPWVGPGCPYLCLKWGTSTLQVCTDHR